jgi:Flp pilus assembly protein TadB
MKRLLRWEMPGGMPPKHPYRDTLIVYATFAAIVVLVAWATGGAIGRAFAFAAVFFVIACGWSWSRWYRRRRDAARGGPDGVA